MLSPLKIQSDATTRSAIAVFCAYAWWGITPAYFRYLDPVDPVEIIAHRVFWTVLCLTLIKLLQRDWATILDFFMQPSRLLPFLFSSVCLLFNWFLFTWAVLNDHILDTSLGYFINPLISVVLGVVLLGERLRPAQIFSVSLASLGVAQMVLRNGTIPWIALMLAITFAFYGLLRKRAKVDAVTGLSLEMMFGLLPAIGFLVLGFSAQSLSFGAGDWSLSVLLVVVGPVTMIPLLLFGSGAPHLNLATVGILQYVAPTLSFLLAVFAYGEPFDSVKLLGFVCIWAALLIYTIDALRACNRRFALEQAAVPLE